MNAPFVSFPPLPLPDIIDLGRFGVGWHAEAVEAYAKLCVAHNLTRAGAEIERLRARLRSARGVADAQANDESLWFQAVHATEARLQAELRRLHAAIEDAR